MIQRASCACVALVFAAILSACGGTSPSSPSSGAGVGVQGVVMGDGGSVAAASGGHAVATTAATGKITVKVDGTTITAEVSANGTFELENVPSGTFTLVFYRDGVEIGRVVVTAPGGAEVKIVVQIQGATIVVIEIKVEGTGTPGPSPSSSPSPAACLIEGGRTGQGIELEGNVSSGSYAAFKMAVNGERADALVDVSASSASFRCIGGAKAPSDAECKASVKAGAKVHVSGTLMTCTATAAQVTATEVKVQKD
jgi:hypothetical protein